MKALQWEKKRVRLAGTRELPYCVFGSGLPVLLANGLGASVEVWQSLVAHAGDRYRFMAWDYRGLRLEPFGPEPPHSIAEHALDALAILDAEGVTSCSIVGWSMGVSVALDLFAQAPGRVRSLALLSGGARAAWAPGPDRSALARIIVRALQVMKRNPRLSRALLYAALRSPEAFAWARRLGIVGELVTSDLFSHIVSSLLEFDLVSYVGTLERLGEYDATGNVRQVDVPTLVIGGDRDPFTPRAALERMVQSIAGAEYLLLPGANHFALLDQAERVNLRIEKFWNERGYAAG